MSTQAQLAQSLADFIQRRVDLQLYDERRSMPLQLYKWFCEQGFFGLQVPSSWGGQNWTNLEAYELAAKVAEIDVNLALWLGQNNSLGIRPIIEWGSQKQKEKYLRPLAEGKFLASFAVTDREGGSYPQAMQTHLKQEGQKWRLNGEKWFIGNGAWSDVLCVLAKHRDEKDGAYNDKLSVVLVDTQQKGVKVKEELSTLGVRSAVQNVIAFDDVEIHEEDFLGEKGKGARVAGSTMQSTRIGIAAVAVGSLNYCHKQMLESAAPRIINTGLQQDNDYFQNKLNEISLQVYALNELFCFSAIKMDKEEKIPEEVHMACKVLGSEFAWHGADTLMQSLGGRGYLENFQASKRLRDVRVLRILEGPNETLLYHMGLQARRPGLFKFLKALGANQTRLSLLQSNLDLFKEKTNSENQLSSHFLIFLGRLVCWVLLEAIATFEKKQSIAQGIERWVDEEISKIRFFEFPKV